MSLICLRSYLGLIGLSIGNFSIGESWKSLIIGVIGSIIGAVVFLGGRNTKDYLRIKKLSGKYIGKKVDGDSIVELKDRTYEVNINYCDFVFQRRIKCYQYNRDGESAGERKSTLILENGLMGFADYIYTKDGAKASVKEEMGIQQWILLPQRNRLYFEAMPLVIGRRVSGKVILEPILHNKT